MNQKIFALPVVVALAALIGTQMFAPAQPQAQSPLWDVTTLDLPAVEPVKTEVAAKPAATTTGPGYNPANQPDCNCANCNCDELEKRVAALEQKVAAYGTARPVASNGSSGVKNYGSTGVSSVAGIPPLPYGATLVSERVTATYEGVPQAMQAPQFQQAPKATPVRNAVKGVARGTCRMVNGVLVGCD
jgi:hypothetical protein